MRTAILLLLTLVMVSCGSDGGHFRIEGQFKNLNQGEFLIYSPDGGTGGIDTITVVNGKFTYETVLDRSATFVILFPNSAEQVVFGEPGKTVTIKGDAYNLQEMTVKGTGTNKQMTEFRLRANELTPPEAKKHAATFVRENPTSQACFYVIDKYFIKTVEPDYGKAYELTEVMVGADGSNVRAASLSHQLKTLMNSDTGSALPHFTAVDLEGDTVTEALYDGRVNVAHVYASWSYESRSMMWTLRDMKKKLGDTLSVMTVCIDARPSDCRKTMKKDSITWPVVCDSMMWSSPLLCAFGIATVPGNVVYDAGGKAAARGLTSKELKEKINTMKK